MDKEMSYNDYKNMTVGPKKQKRRPFYANKRDGQKLFNASPKIKKLETPKINKRPTMPKEMGSVSKYYNKGGYVITGR